MERTMTQHENALAAYLETKQHLWSQNWLKNAASHIRTCLKLSYDLNPEELFDRLSRAKYKPYTIKTYLLAASGFEKAWKGSSTIESFMKRNAFVFRHVYQEKTKRMTEEEFKQIFASTKNPGILNLLVLLGQCGLRKEEALTAKWDDFDQKICVLKVIGKGRKVRHLPLNSKWLAPTEGPLIAAKSETSFRTFIYSTGFGFHDFRAYFATKLANDRDFNIKDVQFLLGHSSLETTQKYVRVDWEKVHRLRMKG